MNQQPHDRLFRSQPAGFTTLFFTELWERFSYYGMRAILLLFLVAAVADGGLGIDERHRHRDLRPVHGWRLHHVHARRLGSRPVDRRTACRAVGWHQHRDRARAAGDCGCRGIPAPLPAWPRRDRARHRTAEAERQRAGGASCTMRAAAPAARAMPVSPGSTSASTSVRPSGHCWLHGWRSASAGTSAFFPQPSAWARGLLYYRRTRSVLGAAGLAPTRAGGVALPRDWRIFQVALALVALVVALFFFGVLSPSPVALRNGSGMVMVAPGGCLLPVPAVLRRPHGAGEEGHRGAGRAGGGEHVVLGRL